MIRKVTAIKTKEETGREKAILNRQLTRLRYYLSLAKWTKHQARPILLGIDPDKSGEVHGAWGAWLPGGLQANGANQDGSWDAFTVEQNTLGNLEYARAVIRGKRRSPADWVEKAKSKQKINIPWLSQALKDRFCFNYLNTKKPDLNISNKPSETAYESHKDRFQRKAKILIIKKYDLWESEGPERISKRQFIEKLNDDYLRDAKDTMVPARVTGHRTIGGWVNDLMRPKPPKWVKRLRAELAEK